MTRRIDVTLQRVDPLARAVQLALEGLPLVLPLIVRRRRCGRGGLAIGVELCAGRIAVALGVVDPALELLHGLVQIRARGFPFLLTRAELLARAMQLVLQAGAKTVPDLTAGIVRVTRAGEIGLELRARRLPRLPLRLQPLVDFLMRGVVLRASLVELVLQPLDCGLRVVELLLQIRALGVAFLLMTIERGACLAQLRIERARVRLVIAARRIELVLQPLDGGLRVAELLLQIRSLGVALLLVTVERRADVVQLGAERARARLVVDVRGVERFARL
ncbi:MAG TPA: hypothetical protein VHB78_07190, partial [Vicinamibacterales bacterium]|nr:hypothetical protein [Vicinamibacterales bacterium]